MYTSMTNHGPYVIKVILAFMNLIPLCAAEKHFIYFLNQNS